MPVTHLTVITAVKPGRHDELRTLLGSIPTGAASPFARIPGTHNGRWALIDTSASLTAPLRAGGLVAPMLVCSAAIDSTPAQWLSALLAEVGGLADEIWGHCPGWPTTDHVGHLLAHQVKPHLGFATWDEPAAEIRRALDCRGKLVDFAVRTQGLPAAELLDAYRREFS